MKTDNEKEALLKLFLSKQAETNENLIKEQSKQIEYLKSRCDSFERELKNSFNTNDGNSSNQEQIQDLKEEVLSLRSITYRLNVELSSYQSKYPSPSLEASINVFDLNSAKSLSLNFIILSLNRNLT